MFEKGNQDIDYWYYWKKTSLFKEDYEPVREENAVKGLPDRVLTRFGWNHVYSTNLLFVDGKIEVLFVGPGKTPFVRKNDRFHERLFKDYLKTHRNLVSDINSECTAGSPPSYYKTAGKKLHFPDIVKIYEGWPSLR